MSHQNLVKESFDSSSSNSRMNSATCKVNILLQIYLLEYFGKDCGIPLPGVDTYCNISFRISQISNIDPF